jgi:hypothetical protein
LMIDSLLSRQNHTYHHPTVSLLCNDSLSNNNPHVISNDDDEKNR